MKPSARLEQLVSDVRTFLVLFRELHDATPRLSWMEMPVGPNDSLELLKGNADFQDLIDRTAQASGRAEAAARDYGGLIRLGAQGPAVNPISNWRSSFNPIHSITRGTIENYCNQLIGRLGHLAADARLKEQGFVGRLAAFLRIPSEIRDAIGPTASRNARRGAFFFGIVVQVVASLIAAGLLAAIGLLVTRVH